MLEQFARSLQRALEDKRDAIKEEMAAGKFIGDQDAYARHVGQCEMIAAVIDDIQEARRKFVNDEDAPE